MSRAAWTRAGVLLAAALAAATPGACSSEGASAAGCDSDDDCKGARLCRDGNCVDPGGGGAAGEGGGGGAGGSDSCAPGTIPVVWLEGVPREGESELVVRGRVFSSGPVGAGALPREATGATHVIELHDQQETLVVNRLYYSVEHEECAAQLELGQPVVLTYVTVAPWGASTGAELRDELQGSLLFAAEAGNFGTLATGAPELVLTPEQPACSYEDDCGSWRRHAVSAKVSGLQGPLVPPGELALLDLGPQGVAFLELDEWRTNDPPVTCSDQPGEFTGYVFSRPSPPGRLFACGDVACRLFEQYCQRQLSDVAGEPDVHSCLPFAGCVTAVPHCECVAGEPCGASCEEARMSEVVVTCPGG